MFSFYLENLLGTSGPSSPSNLSSVTLVGSTGSGSVDKTDTTPTEEKPIKFYGKAPKSPLPERKRPHILSTVGSSEERRTVVTEMTTNIQPPTPTTSHDQSEWHQNGHSTVTVSPITPSTAVVMGTTTIHTAIASTAKTATAIVPQSPSPVAQTGGSVVSPNKTTITAGSGLGLNQSGSQATMQNVIITTTASSVVSPQVAAAIAAIAISPPHLSVHSTDRRPSVGCNIIPHAALCQHRYSLQLNGDGGVKVGQHTSNQQTPFSLFASSVLAIKP